MDPDKQHEIFQKGFDAGQRHADPSPKTIEMFGQMRKELFYELDTKVSWKSFNLVLGITMSVVVGMFYLVWDGLQSVQDTIRDVDQKTHQTAIDVSKIDGRTAVLDKIEFTSNK